MNILRKASRRVAMLASQLSIPEGRREVRHVRLPGFEILALANEVVGRQILYLRDYEPDESAFFRQQIRSEDICFDVGGNVGYYSMLMGRCAARGQVHVFEPIPLNAAMIRTSAELNAFDNLTINTVAVGSEKGATTFSVSVDSAYSSLRATGRRAEERSIDVPIVSLDDYMAEHGIPRVDILKVDVEGAEGLVILGANRMLRGAGRPRIVLLELFDENLKPFGTDVGTIVKKMADMVYAAKVLVSDGSLQAYNASMANRIYNIFFVTQA
jgi:FkbM family methyltransferase